MFKIIRKDVLEMNNLQKIMLLKDRLTVLRGTTKIISTYAVESDGRSNS